MILLTTEGGIILKRSLHAIVQREGWGLVRGIFISTISGLSVDSIFPRMVCCHEEGEDYTNRKPPICQVYSIYSYISLILIVYLLRYPLEHLSG